MHKIIAYYNEIDKHCAAWLRQLIENGDITPGIVDERSIAEVKASDLKGFDRVHLFAGIGIWDYSLTQAGWGDDQVWTGSCPCQPFSIAGKNKGKNDERHLWPEFYRLIRECKPDSVLGEQVAGAIKHGWLDDLSTDLEAEDYAVGSVVFGSHSVDAPHIRNRLYWVADSISKQVNSSNEKRFHAESCGGSRLGNAKHDGSIQTTGQRSTFDTASGIDWLYCRDNKYRPIKSGIKPVVDGNKRKLVCGSNTSTSINADHTTEARVMRLKGYGNAICAPVATEFIKAFLDVEYIAIVDGKSTSMQAGLSTRRPCPG